MRSRTPLILPLAIRGALLAASPAPAASHSRQAASLTFTNETPRKPTGLTFLVDYVNPDDPSAKPPAVREVVTTLARGAAYDISAPDLCRASNAEPCEDA
jgi:hypothetical protein